MSKKVKTPLPNKMPLKYLLMMLLEDESGIKNLPLLPPTGKLEMVNYKVSFSAGPTNDIITGTLLPGVLRVAIVCEADSMDRNIPLYSGRLSGLFNLENVADYAGQESLSIPIELVRQMASVVIGALRGVLHMKLKNTPAQMYVFPPINLKDLVAGDFIIPLPNPFPS